MKDAKKIFSFYVTEFTNLLCKFEILYKLDEKRILIPSLLPDNEEDACIVYSKALSSYLVERSELIYSDDQGSEGWENLGQLDLQIFCRYHLLPFVPNGFFTRLIARLASSDIIDHLHNSIKSDFLDAIHFPNTIHWSCWRHGMSLVWNKKEIFRISPLDHVASDSRIVVITKPNSHQVYSTLSGLEVKVAIIPEQKIRVCTFLEPAVQRMRAGSDDIYSNPLSNPSKGRCIASWLMHRATSMIDSVLQDWYNGLGSSDYNDETSISKMANYCTQCLNSVRQAAYSEVISSLYMFSSTYCCLAACKGELLECPIHGQLRVEDVAPDLVSILCICM